VTHPSSVTLYGVEDPTAYLEHLATYQAVHPKQQDASQHMDGLLSVLHELQEILYSKDLNALTKNATDYAEEQIAFSEYLQYLNALAAKHQLSLEPYPNLDRLFLVVSLERRIDRQAVGQEHRQLLEALSQHLIEQDLQALLAHQLAFQRGKLSQAQYYKGLRRYARKAGIRLTLPEPAVTQAARVVNQMAFGLPQSPYANLIAYTESLLLSEAIKDDQLASELDQLVSAMKDQLLTTPEQRQLDQLLS
jgi:hypothetical protein